MKSFKQFLENRGFRGFPGERRWDADGSLNLDLVQEEGKWSFDSYPNKPVPASIEEEIDKIQAKDYCYIELSINSKGSHIPSSMYGGRDHLGWPEEHDEERMVASGVIVFDNKKVPLSHTAISDLEGLFQKEIDDVEVDQSASEPDYEPDNIDPSNYPDVDPSDYPRHYDP